MCFLLFVLYSTCYWHLVTTWDTPNQQLNCGMNLRCGALFCLSVSLELLGRSEGQVAFFLRRHVALALCSLSWCVPDSKYTSISVWSLRFIRSILQQLPGCTWTSLLPRGLVLWSKFRSLRPCCGPLPLLFLQSYRVDRGFGNFYCMQFCFF